MKQQTYDKIIYSGAILPLTAGTSIFFYWFYQRNFHAINADIELISFFAILSFLLFGSVTVILCMIYLAKFKKHWKRLGPALFIVAFTIPAIILYDAVYSMNSKKAFVRITNDSETYKVRRIWSANFEMVYLLKEGNEFVVSYEPVYVYDWTKEDSFGYQYEINDVFIDLVTHDNKLKTFKMPSLEKGVCDNLIISELTGE